nr:MAG TPA: hypothetical protein [Caudoviricetes sp.]
MAETISRVVIRKRNKRKRSWISHIGRLSVYY